MRRKKEFQFNVIIERDEEGWYLGSVPELKACYTQARSLDDLMSRIEEAIQGCLDADGEPRQGSSLVGVQRITLRHAAAA